MPDNEIEIIPWFGGNPMYVLSLKDIDKVAYSWTTNSLIPDEPKTIQHLLLWHNCDHSVWLLDPTKKPDIVRDYMGWTPAGCGLHTFISAEPLHIEPSVYWPNCCGIHGFIRDGKWIDA